MTERSEKQKMLVDELYNSAGSELTGERRHAQRLLAHYNATEPDDDAGRLAPLRGLLGAVGESPDVQRRFHCDYGYNIRLGASIARRSRSAVCSAPE